MEENITTILMVTTIGLPLLMAIGWLREASENRALRLELRRTAQSLFLAEKVGGVGTWIVDVAKQEVHWSDQVFVIHGRKHSAGTPSLEDAFEYYHPDDRAGIEESVTRAIADGKSFEFSATLIAEDGKQKNVMSRGLCQLDNAGKALRLFGVFIERSPEVRIDPIDKKNIGVVV